MIHLMRNFCDMNQRFVGISEIVVLRFWMIDFKFNGNFRKYFGWEFKQILTVLRFLNKFLKN